MILRLFDSRDAVAFAKAVALDIDELFPPEKRPEEKSLSRPKEAKKFEKILERIFVFSEQKRLNFYTKARFLNTLRWELRERGHDSAFVDKLIGAITPRL